MAEDRINDRTVFCFAQAHILDVLGLVARLTQPAHQSRRQLGIDQKLHFASDKTA